MAKLKRHKKGKRRGGEISKLNLNELETLMHIFAACYDMSNFRVEYIEHTGTYEIIPAPDKQNIDCETLERFIEVISKQMQLIGLLYMGCSLVNGSFAISVYPAPVNSKSLTVVTDEHELNQNTRKVLEILKQSNIDIKLNYIT